MSVKIKCIIFDLDKALTCIEKHRTYNGIENLLAYLKDSGYIVALASYNINAHFVLINNKIDHYFDKIVCEDWNYETLQIC